MITFHDIKGQIIAAFPSDYPVISSVEDVMNFWGDILYSGCIGVILPQSILSSDFFDLKTGLAGEILQKFTNYRLKLAIVGEFNQVESKSLRDFIRESNARKQVNFVGSMEEALVVLAG